MKQVKGTLLVTFVKGIRANKSGVYDKLITDKDKEIVNQKILNSAWYSFETFKNCVNAVSQVVAKGNSEIVKNWGRMYGEIIMKSIYKSAVTEGTPQKAWTSFNRLFKLWFNFGSQFGEFVSDEEVHITYKEFDPDFENYYYLAEGWIARFFELALGKKVISKFIAKSWEGAEETILQFSWN